MTATIRATGEEQPNQKEELVSNPLADKEIIAPIFYPCHEEPRSDRMVVSTFVACFTRDGSLRAITFA
jgi:hypothetical protein